MKRFIFMIKLYNYHFILSTISILFYNFCIFYIFSDFYKVYQTTKFCYFVTITKTYSAISEIDTDMPVSAVAEYPKLLTLLNPGDLITSSPLNLDPEIILRHTPFHLLANHKQSIK